ncbi:E3 ubiquitin-protein ligase RING1-like protein [Triticum urartu]|uniref:RING-type E3 ubiquitin transferase n=2 Tax=Triticum TaxID=4564 RepID=A0A9R0ZBE5_TRITD|nr:E3 ubiquitin-protein ligase RING1-like protein [Triticum urartu]VAI73981.1 unnamed protein product [Triticum turgidum subsp. durum]
MASPYLLHRLTADEIFQTLEASSSTSSSCYDAFVPVFRPDPSASALSASVPAEEFDWEEVAFASGPSVENPEPDWEMLGDMPPSAPAGANEGFVYTSDREAYEVLVAVGDGLFLTNKPPAARSAVKALPSAIVAAGEEGEGEECSVCKDGVVAGERVKMMPCSHRYHEDCILPWLEVRNSCPLCRFELPTDNPKYETWKAERAMAA